MSRIQSMLEWLRKVWAELDPSLGMSAPAEPTVRSLDADRTEFSWMGKPFVFDSRLRTISRAGKIIATYDAVKVIGVSEHRGDDGESWSVFFEIGFLKNVGVGSTREQVDASIAGAQIAKIMGKKVQKF